jgi:hypothetical protein
MGALSRFIRDSEMREPRDSSATAEAMALQ